MSAGLGAWKSEISRFPDLPTNSTWARCGSHILPLQATHLSQRRVYSSLSSRALTQISHSARSCDESTQLCMLGPSAFTNFSTLTNIQSDIWGRGSKLRPSSTFSPELDKSYGRGTETYHQPCGLTHRAWTSYPYLQYSSSSESYSPHTLFFYI